MKIENYIADFISTKHTQGVSALYVNVMKACITEFAEFMELNGVRSPDKVSMAEVKEYEDYLKTRKKKRSTGTLSSVMIRQNLNSVKYFFQYLFQIEAIDENPMNSYEMPKAISAKRVILTKEEIMELLKACQSLKEMAIILLAYGAGLRRQEITDLNCQDIDFRSNILHVQKGKGKKYRKIHLPKKVSEDLKKYFSDERPALMKIKKKMENAFLISGHGNRMSGSTIGKNLNQILSRTPIKKKISLHNLRHSIACHLIDEGMALSKVQKFLGHTFMDTTQIYTQYTKKRI